MIIKPKCRGFICTTAHPTGCYKNVEDMANKAIELQIPDAKKPKNVIIIGASTGYGLASRVAAAFSYKAKTIGVSFEKEAAENRTATAGFYNNRAFDELSVKAGIPCRTINGDAFSEEIKEEVVQACKDIFKDEKADLLVYSLAAPKRTHPNTKITYSSVIKPIGSPYSSKTVDFHTGEVSEVSIDPASDDEITDTIKVMGGEDWYMWIERLIAENLLADDFITVSYSYIGPTLTHPIYKNGTIGKAKDDLLEYCKKINSKLSGINGNAYVSVNKALVTQSSSAIPVVPLYISILYKVMKQKGLHEGCFEQIHRLYTDRIYSGRKDFADSENYIRMDDYEMRPDVQSEIDTLWQIITSENINALTDLQSYKDEFFSLFGFLRNDVDYDLDISQI